MLAGEVQICDIIGNALADEAASVASKLLRPNPVTCKASESIHHTAFNICLRIGFTQAREWELLADAPIYEAPPEPEHIDLSIGSAFQQAADDLALAGHDLVLERRGHSTGHFCTRCKRV